MCELKKKKKRERGRNKAAGVLVVSGIAIALNDGHGLFFSGYFMTFITFCPIWYISIYVIMKFDQKENMSVCFWKW